MATEEGLVTRTTENRAWVKTQRSAACESCSTRGACTSLGSKDMEVETLNEAGAVKGDRVLISFDNSKLVGISFLLYIVPILVLIAGAVLGEKLAPVLELNESVASALGGFTFFGLAFLGIRLWSSMLADKQNYQPRISKVLPQE